MLSVSHRPVWFVVTRHWLSLVGICLIATAVISWLFVLPVHVRGHIDNPYTGIIVFLILPTIFFTGLLLVPIGVYLSKRQIQKRLTEEVLIVRPHSIDYCGSSVSPRLSTF